MSHLRTLNLSRGPSRVVDVFVTQMMLMMKQVGDVDDDRPPNSKPQDLI